MCAGSSARPKTSSILINTLFILVYFPFASKLAGGGFRFLKVNRNVAFFLFSFEINDYRTTAEGFLFLSYNFLIAAAPKKGEDMSLGGT